MIRIRIQIHKHRMNHELEALIICIIFFHIIYMLNRMEHHFNRIYLYICNPM